MFIIYCGLKEQYSKDLNKIKDILKEVTIKNEVHEKSQYTESKVSPFVSNQIDNNLKSTLEKQIEENKKLRKALKDYSDKIKTLETTVSNKQFEIDKLTHQLYQLKSQAPAAPQSVKQAIAAPVVFNNSKKEAPTKSQEPSMTQLICSASIGLKKLMNKQKKQEIHDDHPSEKASKVNAEEEIKSDSNKKEETSEKQSPSFKIEEVINQINADSEKITNEVENQDGPKDSLESGTKEYSPNDQLISENKTIPPPLPPREFSDENASND
jgi:hypothetical protein